MRDRYLDDVIEGEVHERKITWVVVVALLVALAVGVAALAVWAHAAS